MTTASHSDLHFTATRMVSGVLVGNIICSDARCALFDHPL